MQGEQEYEFFTRYDPGSLPDSETMCQGQCEGTGVVPIHASEEDPKWRALWEAEHAKRHKLSQRIKDAWACRVLRHEFGLWRALVNMAQVLHEPCDGWHFVECPDCKGTGQRAREAQR